MQILLTSNVGKPMNASMSLHLLGLRAILRNYNSAHQNQANRFVWYHHGESLPSPSGLEPLISRNNQFYRPSKIFDLKLFCELTQNKGHFLFCRRQNHNHLFHYQTTPAQRCQFAQLILSSKLSGHFLKEISCFQQIQSGLIRLLILRICRDK